MVKSNGSTAPVQQAAAPTEITKAQVLTIVSTGELTNPLPKTFATYRTMRRNPTIAMARALSTAPIVASKWTVKHADDVPEERIEYVVNELIPLRNAFLQTALNGGVDFGWQGFEKVFGLNENNRIRVSKLKPLLHDITEILVKADTGAFNGFLNGGLGQGFGIVVPVDNSLLIPFRVEGTNWYGESMLENIRTAYDDWVLTSCGAQRYDKKIAGTHWIVTYPIGTSPDADGNEVTNDVLAKLILQSLESSGSVAIPQNISDWMVQSKITNLHAWDIKLLSDQSPKQASFVSRLAYLDTIFVRGLMLPERTILEGKFGTKAEAGVHQDVALTYMELIHADITRLFNWHVVDQLLALNWGSRARGTIWMEAATLASSERGWLQEVYKAILSNPQGFIQEFPTIDTHGLKAEVGVPKIDELGLEEEDDKDDFKLPVEDNPIESSVRNVIGNGSGNK